MLAGIAQAARRGVLIKGGVLSLAGVVPLSVAVVIHEGSTVVVVLNALRLLVWREQPGTD